MGGIAPKFGGQGSVRTGVIVGEGSERLPAYSAARRRTLRCLADSWKHALG